jgi:serine protease AprX
MKRIVTKRRNWILGFTALLTLSLLPTYGGVEGRRPPAVGKKISPVLAGLLDGAGSAGAIPVIVQLERQHFSETEGLRQARGEGSPNALVSIHGYASRLTPSEIKLLLESELVEYVTLDMPITSTKRSTDGSTGGGTKGGGGGSSSGDVGTDPGSLDHIRQTLGVDQIQVKGKTPTGRNINVAVFDSGIGLNPDIVWNGNKVLTAVDFTSGSPVEVERNVDEYGHGTHIAGIIAGDGESFQGIAPDAQFLDLKVIAADGTGLTSNLIQAIDWVIEHKGEFAVRVANLSLGHPPVESYTTDPLCQAVERMVEAGIVTIVSAGNLGKTAEYQRIWSLTVTISPRPTPHEDPPTSTNSSSPIWWPPATRSPRRFPRTGPFPRIIPSS